MCFTQTLYVGAIYTTRAGEKSWQGGAFMRSVYKDPVIWLRQLRLTYVSL